MTANGCRLQMEQLAVLRASAQRLTTTPVEELPRIAHFLASSVSSCNIALQVSPSKSSENTIHVHKLKTRLSSLLHDKTVSGRFTAAVVIKAYVETAPANGPDWESWLRTLIGCLSKPDPWQVKRVYLSTIVRILLLCQHSPQLQREVSTPYLPAFITATLAIIRPSSRQSGSTTRTTTSPLLPCVFCCWDELLQHYGNTIRPFVNRIKPICLSVLSENGHVPSLQDLAAQVLASLYRCSPKNAVQGEWDNSFKLLVKTTHDTLDLVFRGVGEEWSPADLTSSKPSVRHNYSRAPLTEMHDSAGLLPWKGIHDGTLRVINLLRCLEKMLHCSSQPATIPIGELVDLLTRIFSVVIPEMSNTTQYPLRLNAEVGKEEREELWSNLPELHTAGLRLSKTLTLIFGQALFSTFSTIANQVLDLFVTEKWHASIRLQSYELWTSLLQRSPFACTPVDRQNFNDLCRSCCLDLTAYITQLDQRQQANGSAVNTAATAGLKASQTPALSRDSCQRRDGPHSALSRAAQELLTTLLDQAPATVFSTPIRTEMDRGAILLNDERAMYASVLNPPATRPGQRPTPSLIPFLTRISAVSSMAVEALMRPRMPVISAPTVQTVVEEEHEEVVDDTAIKEDVSLTQTSSNHHQHTAPRESTEQTKAAPISHNACSTEEAILNESIHTSTIDGARHKESDTLNKRDFATMQGGTTIAAASTGQQQQQQQQEDPLLKKPRSDPPEAEAEAGAAAEVVLEKDAPYLFKTNEDIKVYSNPITTTTTTMQPGVSSSNFPGFPAAHGDDDDDDSDDSEIPTLDMTMAIGFAEEDEEGEDEEEGRGEGE